ncbi:MAG: matrixin family metalloprotease [Gemmatimonadaceae bacterium]
MRKQDFIPVALLGGIAVFIVVQAVAMRGSAGTAEVATVDPPTSTATRPGSSRVRRVADSADAVDSTLADTAAVVDSADAPGDDVDLVRLESGEPAPVRDLATVQMLIRDGAPGTYLLDMLAQQNDLLMRWPDRRAQAIRVWIERNPAISDWRPEFAVVAEHAFEEWQRAGFPLRFLVLRDSANTEIKIRWVANFPAEIGHKLGMARKLRDQHGWIHSAEITVATHDAQGRRLPAQIVAGTARHEVGHALGLGHSSAPSDVMFPESRTTSISATDRATLRLLYILPPGSVK